MAEKSPEIQLFFVDLDCWHQVDGLSKAWTHQSGVDGLHRHLFGGHWGWKAGLKDDVLCKNKVELCRTVQFIRCKIKIIRAPFKEIGGTHSRVGLFCKNSLWWMSSGRAPMAWRWMMRSPPRNAVPSWSRCSVEQRPGQICRTFYGQKNSESQSRYCSVFWGKTWAFVIHFLLKWMISKVVLRMILQRFSSCWSHFKDDPKLPKPSGPRKGDWRGPSLGWEQRRTSKIKDRK